MQDTKRETTGPRKDGAANVHMVVEVDGNPIGYLDLDIDRLWPLINHRRRDKVPVEWMNEEEFESIMRAAVARHLLARLRKHLYQALGDEIVKAELDVESIRLKAEEAAQTFGPTRADIEQLAAENDRTVMDFYTFFWEYLLKENDIKDLKKAWKTAARK